jgi:hypothetical protein
MTIRFWRRKKLFPGVTANLSKSGLSMSLGVRGAHYTVGPGGQRITIGATGTGLFVTEKIGRSRRRLVAAAPSQPQPGQWRWRYVLPCFFGGILISFIFLVWVASLLDH